MATIGLGFRIGLHVIRICSRVRLLWLGLGLDKSASSEIELYKEG